MRKRNLNYQITLLVEELLAMGEIPLCMSGVVSLDEKTKLIIKNNARHSNKKSG